MLRPLLLTTAAAALASSLAHASDEFATGSLLRESQLVQAPRGFRDLCASRPEFCIEQRVQDEVDVILDDMRQAYGPDAGAVSLPELTPQRRDDLQRVNLVVNQAIFPREDGPRDEWSFTAFAGDCEEYVLMKQQTLAHMGWPRSAMRIAVVRGTTTPYHAVLLVATAGGEFVLDNLNDDIVPVAQSRYEFVVAQSLVRPGEWVRVSR